MLTIRDIFILDGINDLPRGKSLEMLDKLSSQKVINAPELHEERFKTHFLMSDTQLFQKLTSSFIKSLSNEDTKINTITFLFAVYLLVGKENYIKAYLDQISLQNAIRMMENVDRDARTEDIYNYLGERMVNSTINIEDQKDNIKLVYISSLTSKGEEDEAIRLIRIYKNMNLWLVFVAAVSFAREKVYKELSNRMFREGSSISYVYRKALEFAIQSNDRKSIEMIGRNRPPSVTSRDIREVFREVVPFEFYRMQTMIALYKYFPDVDPNRFPRFPPWYTEYFKIFLNDQV